MANPRQVTLGVHDPKKDAVFGVGTVAANTVEIEFDQDANQLDVVTALEKVIELIIEQEY